MSLNPILEGLNQRQTEAVQSALETTLVIAGAGSGKTAVLTRRCAYLIGLGIIPGQILCLTFTNKAAAEMNQRVMTILQTLGIDIPVIKPWQNDYLSTPLLCTFHSLGVRILREFGYLIDLKANYTILDSDDQKRVVKEVLQQKNLDPKNVAPELVLYFISQCKQQLLTASESKKISREFLPVFHQLYDLYEQNLHKSQAVDFDDLILMPYVLLRDFEEVRHTLQNRWKHIMVDEFQDTNQAQFELIKLLYQT